MTRKKIDTINVIPFIDIMLVLLVIVLTTATFISQGIIPLSLPQGESSKQPPAKKIEISIESDGTIHLEERIVTPSELKKQLATYTTEDTFLIRSDKAADFEHFVTVIDLLKQQGLDEVGIVTLKE